MKANTQTGGACALVYNENRFEVKHLKIHVPKGVEACWSVFKPKNKTDIIEHIEIVNISKKYCNRRPRGNRKNPAYRRHSQTGINNEPKKCASKNVQVITLNYTPHCGPE